MSSSNDNPEIKEQIVEKNEFLDFDGTSEDVIEYSHALQKREAQWKAYGFDSKALQITDPWASRNLWFQQLTHSVRSVRTMNCPCVVKVPTPGIWPSIFRGSTRTTASYMSILCIIMVVVVSAAIIRR